MTVHELAQRHPTAYNDAIEIARMSCGSTTVVVARDGVTIYHGSHQLPNSITITTEVSRLDHSGSHG